MIAVLRDLWAQLWGTTWIEQRGTVYLHRLDGEGWIRVDYYAYRYRPLFGGVIYRS